MTARPNDDGGELDTLFWDLLYEYTVFPSRWKHEERQISCFHDIYCCTLIKGCTKHYMHMLWCTEPYHTVQDGTIPCLLYMLCGVLCCYGICVSYGCTNWTSASLWVYYGVKLAPSAVHARSCMLTSAQSVGYVKEKRAKSSTGSARLSLLCSQDSLRLLRLFWKCFHFHISEMRLLLDHIRIPGRSDKVRDNDSIN